LNDRIHFKSSMPDWPRRSRLRRRARDRHAWRADAALALEVFPGVGDSIVRTALPADEPETPLVYVFRQIPEFPEWLLRARAGCREVPLGSAAAYGLAPTASCGARDVNQYRSLKSQVICLVLAGSERGR
jgi:hypothetical protein